MKSNQRKKFFKLSVASLFSSVAFLFLSANLIAADSLSAPIQAITSLNIFSLVAYVFFACSIIFFFWAILKKN
jgi:uncharacterized membrane protein YesL